MLVRLSYQCRPISRDGIGKLAVSFYSGWPHFLENWRPKSRIGVAPDIAGKRLELLKEIILDRESCGRSHLDGPQLMSALGQ
jgi:hypothetical protein